MRKRASYMGVLLAIVGALVIAGCGGGGSSSSSSESESGGAENAAATTSSEGGSVEGTIAGAEIGGLGNVLVDSEGMTVYLYTPDTGTESTCYGACESAWPPVLTEGKPTAGEGAMSAALGTTKRKDGTMQVTYEGHPLYTFSGDKAPGEANGQEIEGIWFVLDESGDQVEGTAEAAGETEASEESGGRSYGGY
jgi:predicted lipoprotein with Yx(FWY)xxD motif